MEKRFAPPPDVHPLFHVVKRVFILNPSAILITMPQASAGAEFDACARSAIEALDTRANPSIASYAEARVGARGILLL